MSQSAKGKVFPKKGRVFPQDELDSGYARTIALALRQDLGNTHQAAKTAMKWTGARERTVKNWLAAKGGPSGAHLIGLMRHSNAVCEAVLLSAGRERVIVAQKLGHAKAQLEFILEEVRALAE